jgi:hypothetical protein
MCRTTNNMRTAKSMVLMRISNYGKWMRTYYYMTQEMCAVCTPCYQLFYLLVTRVAQRLNNIQFSPCSMPYTPGVTFIYAWSALARPSVVDEIIVVPKQTVANQRNSIYELDFCISTVKSDQLPHQIALNYKDIKK